MHSRFRTKGVLLAALVAFLATAVLPGVASAEPQPGAPKKGFRLFARALGAITINRVLCGLSSAGQICTDSLGSSTIGGALWPKGTPDQYVFNSGLQIAGIVGSEGGSSNPWVGDTAGAFFFDPKGTTEHGEQVLPIYNAVNPDDRNAWPAAACVPQDSSSADPDFNGSLFDKLLQTDPTNTGGNCPGGRLSASQGDVWFMSWEGNYGLRAGRKHPLGIAVETRGMGWNFPTGNEDIIYFIFTFYNITTVNRDDYIAHGIRSSMADILAQKAKDFHQGLDDQGVNGIPQTGYTIENMYAAFAADMDVSDAGANYSSVNLPFALGNTYDHAFSQPSDWLFDPSVFGPPFFTGVGFVGVKYLKSPTGPGEIQLFSNTINGRPFAGAVNDPRDVTQMYRYLSGTQNQIYGDDSCGNFDPVTDHICFINNNSPQDMRFFQSSTPLTLAPGEGGSIVVAYIFAPPVPGGGCPSSSCDVIPGDPRVLTDAAALATTGANPIDTLTGFLGYSDVNGDGVVQQGEFEVVPGSLLGKSLTAQAVFDAKFLLPFAPSSPDFYLVPGDNSVTVVWSPSSSETSGDPYWFVAKDAKDPNTNLPNLLYDPNYRRMDVEGYRVYRGRVDAPNELTLLAQFDYSGTTIVDYVGTINPTASCAPELDILSGCPDNYPAGGNKLDGTQLVDSTEYDLTGDIVQLKVGDRAKLFDTTAIIIKADTAATGHGTQGPCGPKSVCPPLTNSGVPFAYTDATPRNSFRYFYAVTAFDVNSYASGPSSLESPRTTKPVTPTAAASDFSAAKLEFGVYGDDGVKLDPAKPWGIDAATGRFLGSPPPTDALVASFAPLVEALLPAVDLTLRVDSLIMRASFDYPCGAATNWLGSCYEIWTTFDSSGVKTQSMTVAWWPIWVSGDGIDHTDLTAGALKISADPASEQRFNVPSGVASFTAGASMRLWQYIEFSSFEGQAARRGLFGTGTTNFSAGGSRWFEGPDETEIHPTYSIRVGRLPGVDTIWAPIHHTDIDPDAPGAQIYSTSSPMQCFGYAGAGLGRQADVEFTWGPNGTIAGVRDLTHHVPVEFKPDPQATYGFIGDENGDGVVGWDDFYYLESFSQNAEDFGFCNHTDPGPGNRAKLTADPVIGPVSTSGTQVTSTPTGTGFGLYIDGERYIFQLNQGLPPAAGTKWTLRTYSGQVRAANFDTRTPSNYTFRPRARPPVIPGLEVRFSVPSASKLTKVTASSLKQVHTVPDPYYVTSAFEQSSDNKVIKFVNLPTRAVIRIYSASGVLVNVLEHNSQSSSGEETWNVRNRNNQVVASGVYFYHIEATDGDSKTRRVGRMTIVNFAQ
jgi:hypothetical protein